MTVLYVTVLCILNASDTAQIDRLSRDPRGLELLSASPNALSSMLTILEVMSPQFEFLKLFVLVHIFVDPFVPVQK